MKESSVFVDVAIDQGGCAETSRPTTHDDPVYTVDGVIHYCVANMPGAVPITSTRALTNVTLPYIEQLADLGVDGRGAREPRARPGRQRDPGQGHVRGRLRGARHAVHAARRRARGVGLLGRGALRPAEEAAARALVAPLRRRVVGRVRSVRLLRVSLGREDPDDGERDGRGKADDACDVDNEE